jgi:hypothetical protein
VVAAGAVWLVLAVWLVWSLASESTVLRGRLPSGEHADTSTSSGMLELYEMPAERPLVISRHSLDFTDAKKLWKDHAPDVVWDADHKTVPIPMTARGLDYLRSIGR